MSSDPADARHRSLRPWVLLHDALMPDYNRPATIYWWTMVALGAAVLAWSIGHLAGLSQAMQGQILAGCGVAILAGLFPVRIPGSKNSFAAGEVFILSMLLVYGPAAAALAAAGESFVGSVRTTRRWTSRLISPAITALSMAATGSMLQAALSLLDLGTVGGKAGMMLLTMLFASAHFLVNLVLITVVPHLKSGQPMRLESIASNFGWIGTTYAASALIAGLLYLAFQASGIGVVAGAVPLVIVLLVMLHYHFRQRETDDRVHQQRIEAAEREVAQTAAHLQALRASEQRFQRAFSHAAIGMALVSDRGEVLQANPALCALVGLPAEAVVGQAMGHFVHPDDAGLLQGHWEKALEHDGQGANVELRLCRPGGETVIVALHSGQFSEREARSPCLIVQAQDVTARRDAEAKLQHIAYHDSLTSLANRVRFGECLAEAIDRARADQRYRYAVMYLDFDRFKLINDTLGHHAGDQFLSLVARRIRGHVRPQDTVGRLGGDEFAILVEGLDDEGLLLAMADRLQAALGEPYVLQGSELASSASIGITFGSLGYETPGEVLRDADIAMYRAKQAGRGRTALFDASLRAQLAAQVDLERDLRRALEQHQLSLAFQPIYELQTGRVESLEALVRWQHPQRGDVSPATFLPIAEDSALMATLTRWVLDTACAELRRIQREQPGGRRPNLHVNVSGTDMCRPAFVSQVSHALLQHGLEPQQLTLEITETMLMQRLDSALAVMGQLRELGVGLSVDDFGTGYSSLSYLSTLPITSLKIDRSFVARLQDKAQDAEVVKAVITLGVALGKTVIAEGIETPAQLAQLRALGCTLGQGYLLARPLTPDGVALALAPGRPWPGPDARASAFGMLATEGTSAILH